MLYAGLFCKVTKWYLQDRNMGYQAKTATSQNGDNNESKTATNKNLSVFNSKLRNSGVPKTWQDRRDSLKLLTRWHDWSRFDRTGWRDRRDAASLRQQGSCSVCSKRLNFCACLSCIAICIHWFWLDSDIGTLDNRLSYLFVLIRYKMLPDEVER